MFGNMAVGTGRATRAEIENPARLLERQKMPAACRPKNEAANFIFPPWIRLFFRYPCVPPTPLQLSSVAMTSHTCLAGVPHDAWSGRVPTAGSRSVYSSRFQSPLQVVAVRLDKLAVVVVGGKTARWSSVSGTTSDPVHCCLLFGGGEGGTRWGSETSGVLSSVLIAGNPANWSSEPLH